MAFRKQGMDLNRFISELRRRKVFRVVIAHGLRPGWTSPLTLIALAGLGNSQLGVGNYTDSYADLCVFFRTPVCSRAINKATIATAATA